MLKYHALLFSGLVLIFAVSVLGQESLEDKSRVCTERPSNRGKYKVLSMEPGGKESQFYLEIKPKYRSDENYIAIAKEFKERYCREDQLRIIYFASKGNWMIVDLKNLDATPLAIFFSGKKTDEKEGISVYQVVNGKVEGASLILTNKGRTNEIGVTSAILRYS